MGNSAHVTGAFSFFNGLTAEIDLEMPLIGPKAVRQFRVLTITILVRFVPAPIGGAGSQ